jgi:hypothetical protein
MPDYFAGGRGMKVGLEEYDALACPSCGETYLHQGTVEFFFRAAEDAPSKVLVAKSDGTIATTSPNPNPSSRRQGLLIHFQCEYCHITEGGDWSEKTAILEIYQHKGQTFMEWQR